MKKILFSVFLVTFICNIFYCQHSKIRTADEVYEEFKQPSNKYLPIAYWFWNGQMNPDTIVWQLKEMKRSNTISGAVIMAWEGLGIKYLSDQWFDRVKLACDVANELNFKIWLYDEILWPSGYAGGKILQDNPQLMARCLAREVHFLAGENERAIDLPKNTVSIVVCRVENDRKKITSFHDWDNERDGDQFLWKVPAGNWKLEVFYEQQCQFHPAFQELNYVDLLNPETTKKLIAMTYERYYQLMPEYFGTTIQAIITDEPGLYCDLNMYGINPGAVAYTPHLFEAFENMKGYDLRRYLPALWENIGEATAAVRIDFYDFLAKQFTRSYLKPLQKWCEKHRIKLNVQPVHEETMKYDALLQGDYFHVMRYSDLPGCDEVYGWDKTNLTPKLASSVARLLGKDEVYCEVFGAYGWDLPLWKMKAVTNWLFARGANRFQLSAFYFSMDNTNWRMEIPPSLFFQNTQWKYLNFLTDYLARMSSILTRAYPVQRIGLYRPNLSLRTLLALENEKYADELDEKLNSLANSLLANKLDFLFVDDYFLGKKSKVISKYGKTFLQIKSGDHSIELEAVIVPFASVLTVDAFAKLQKFYQKGGKVFWVQTGCMSILTEQMNPEQRLQKISNDEIPGAKFEMIDSLIRATKSTILPAADFFPQNRAIEIIQGKLADADVFFIVNNDSSSWKGKVIFHTDGNVVQWNAENGTRRIIAPLEQSDTQTTVSLQLAPFAAKLFVVNHGEEKTVYQMKTEKIGEIFIRNSWQFSAADNSFPEERRKTGTWTQAQKTALAHPYFSGTGIYKNSFSLPRDYIGTEYAILLQVENVREIAEVYVNGKLAGVRCWQPYKFDISTAVVSGKNELEIHVINTPANAYELVPQNYRFGEKWGKVVDSGLLGNVKIIVEKRDI